MVARVRQMVGVGVGIGIGGGGGVGYINPGPPTPCQAFPTPSLVSSPAHRIRVLWQPVRLPSEYST